MMTKTVQETDSWEKIQILVKGIQARKIRSRQKANLTAFYEWYTKSRPEITRRDMKYLLYGNPEHKGLLETCGNTNVKTIMSLKRSSLLALKVLYSLLTLEPNATRFKNLLSEGKIHHFTNMKLHRHIKQFKTGEAFQVLRLILDKNKEYDVGDILGTTQAAQEAAKSFSRWLARQHQQEMERKKKAKNKQPKRWADINEADLELDCSDNEDALPHDMAGAESESDDEVADPLNLLADEDIRIILHSRKQRDIALDGGSLQTCKEMFSPDLFLSTMHSDQSYKELETGLGNLKDNVKDRLKNMRALVKNHFDQFVSCKSIIDDIHDHLKSEVMNRGKGLSKTLKLDNKLQTMQRVADTLYKPLVERKKKTDRIRSALEVLDRFRFFFSLPGNLKKNIKRQKYTEVVRLYQKSKNFKLASDARILHAVEEAVYVIMAKFRETLLKKLENPHASLEEHTVIIGFLENLDCTKNPTWYYLTHRADWMVSVLEKWHKDFHRYASLRSGSGRSRRGKSFRAKTGGGAASGGNTLMPPPDTQQSSRLWSFSAGNGSSSVIEEKSKEEDEYNEEQEDRSFEKSAAQIEGDDYDDVIGEENEGGRERLVIRMARFLSRHLPDFYKLSTRIEGGVKPAPPRTPTRKNNASKSGTQQAQQPGAIDDGRDQKVFNEPGGVRTPAGINPINLQPDEEEEDGLKHSEIRKAMTVEALFSYIQGHFTKYARMCIFPNATIYYHRKVDGFGVGGAGMAIVSSPLSRGISSEGWNALDNAENSRGDDGENKDARKSLTSLHRNVVSITQEFETVERSLTKAPTELLRGLRTLADDAVEYYIRRTFKSAFREIARLGSTEDWIPDERNPSITSVPTRFQRAVTDALEHLNAAMPKKKTQWMVESVVAPFIGCLKLMADVLHSLAFSARRRWQINLLEDPNNAMNHPASPFSRAPMGGGAAGYEEGFERAMSSSKDEETKSVLVVLANLMHIQKRVLPQLWGQCWLLVPRRYVPKIEPETLRVNGLYRTLSRMVMDEYIRSTTLHLSTFITKGLTTSGRDWSKHKTVRKVREYMLELLLEVVLVYDDLIAIVKPFVHKVMKTLVVMLIDSFSSLVRAVDEFSPSGALQVYVEVEFLRNVMKRFLTPSSQDTFRNLKNRLERCIQQAEPNIDGTLAAASNVVSKALRTTSVMYACFDSPIV